MADDPNVGSAGSILAGVDLSDPCAVWPHLQRALYELAIGGGVVKTRFGADEVTFNPADREALRGEIARLKAECAAITTGRPARRAFRAGWR